MTPVELSRTVLRAMRRAVDDGELSGLGDVGVAERVVVERPRPGGCGDYATNVALQVARAAGRPPRQVAEVLSPRLTGEPGIAVVDITGPGFLNITLERSDPRNPGSDSAALVRDVLTQGASYGHVRPGHADSGHVRPGDATPGHADPGHASPGGTHLEQASPSDTHPGPATPGDAGHGPAGHGPATPGPAGHGHASPGPATPGHATPGHAHLHIPQEIRAAVLADAVRRILLSQGTTVRLTCDEAPDPEWATLGVHIDAHGMLPATTPTPLHPLPAPSTPTPLGPDAARWALLFPAAHDRVRISGEHLVQRASNPLFRVRYAYSRVRALSRNAGGLGFGSEVGGVAGGEARALLDALADYPRILAAAARHRAPDRLARHLVVVADAFLAFQPGVLPLGDEKPSAAHRARLALAEAAGTVLAGGLSLLGISAPEYL
ncbi:ArgS-related anticodon-binding protein NrtL [Streptomyces sp. NPDC051218]|uniref:ArgS-related anticodon-binding protein NrtL n=1 Tax=Streptomyces sp. NPDC051218 TaxID=3365645 RepID=UPI0037B43BD9